MECNEDCHGLIIADFLVAKNRKDFLGAYIVARDCAGSKDEKKKCYIARKEAEITYEIQPAKNNKLKIARVVHKGHLPLSSKQISVPLEGRVKELVSFIMRFRKEEYRVLERNYQPGAPLPKALVDYLREAYAQNL